MSLSQRGDDGRGTCATCDARVGSGLSVECVLPLALTEIFVPLLSLSQINAGKGAWAVLQNGVHAPSQSGWLRLRHHPGPKDPLSPGKPQSGTPFPSSRLQVCSPCRLSLQCLLPACETSCALTTHLG